MLKVAKNEFLENKFFLFADNFLKENINRISSKYNTKEELSDQNKADIHYNMVSEITSFFLHISAIFGENDLKKLDKTEANLLILNRYLAIRQLVQSQVEGVMSTKWGLPKEITDSENFKINIARFKNDLTKEQFVEILKVS